jgi:hypothetical protein
MKVFRLRRIGFRVSGKKKLMLKTERVEGQGSKLIVKKQG